MATHIRREALPAALAASADAGYDQQVTRRGVSVRIHGLVTSVAYNGATGIVRVCSGEEEERERAAGGRQPVLLHGGKVLNVRPANLQAACPPLSAEFVGAVRRDLATGDVPIPINRDYFPAMMADVRDPEHPCRMDVVCCRCASRSAPLYLVLMKLAGPRLLVVECTDCAVLIAAEAGVPTQAAAITAFNDHRYRGVFSAIMALQGDVTSALYVAPVHPPGLPGPLDPGFSERFHEY